jgi:hypothetical protein
MAAYDMTVRAMASGEITPDEAVQVSRVLDGRRKAIEAASREAALDARKIATKPSPSGRGLGEGVGRASDGAGTEAARRPHPDPLPWGERMVGSSRSVGEPPHPPIAAQWAPPSPARGEGKKATLLHSTCISRSPPPAWLAASVPRDGFRAGLQRV